MRRGGGPQADSALAVYVRAAVVNGCRSVLGRRALARRMAITVLHCGDTWGSAQHAVILAEDQRRVLAALAVLPSRREVLVLR